MDLVWYLAWLIISFAVGLISGIAAKRLARRPHRSKVAVLLPLLLSAAASLPRAEGEPPSVLNIPSFELYAPARVVVSFTYTRNVTIHVSTLGASLYKAVTSPTQVEFTTESFDVFTVHVEALYELPVNQTVTIGIFEGGRAAKGLEIPLPGKGFTIIMKLTVIEAPRYPTPDEVSDRIWLRFRNEVAEFEAAQREVINTINGSVITLGSLAAISFAVCLALVAAVFHIHGKVSELSEWGLRHEHEHRRREG